MRQGPFVSAITRQDDPYLAELPLAAEYKGIGIVHLTIDEGLDLRGDPIGADAWAAGLVLQP